MSGRFTTVADTDTVLIFMAGRPDAFAAPEAHADWAVAWAFLCTETDTVLRDLTHEQIAERLQANDLAVRTLYSATQGAQLLGSDDVPRARGPWQLHLQHSPPTTPSLLATTPQQFGATVGRLRKGVSVALRKGDRFDGQLGEVRQPTAGLIVVDPYVFAQGLGGVKDSLAPYLDALVPPEARGPLPVLVLSGVPQRGPGGRAEWRWPCAHLERYFDADVDLARDRVEAALAARMRRVQPEVTLVVRPRDLHAYHDRHVFGSYVEVHAGRSSDVLLERQGGGTTVVGKTTTLDAFSVLSPRHRTDVAERLHRIREITRRAERHEVAGPRTHPLFEVLDPD